MKDLLTKLANLISLNGINNFKMTFQVKHQCRFFRQRSQLDRGFNSGRKIETFRSEFHFEPSALVSPFLHFLRKVSRDVFNIIKKTQVLCYAVKSHFYSENNYFFK